jgi:hypothetical protein
MCVGFTLFVNKESFQDTLLEGFSHIKVLRDRALSQDLHATSVSTKKTREKNMAPQQQKMMMSESDFNDPLTAGDMSAISVLDGSMSAVNCPSMMIVVNLKEGEDDLSDDYEASYFDLFPEGNNDHLLGSPRSVIPNTTRSGHQRNLSGSISSLTDLLKSSEVSNGRRSRTHRRALNRALSSKDFERNVLPHLHEQDMKSSLKTDTAARRYESPRQRALVLENLAFPIVLNESFTL